MKQDHYRIEKKQVRDSFNRAATQYDAVAVLQREVGARLIERLELIKLQPQRILDVGSGTGAITRLLSERYKKTEIISLDLATAMLHQARNKQSTWQRWFGKQSYLCGDAEQLPVADNSIDMIFSSLTIQWCSDLDKTFSEFRRVLKPNGLLMFTTFGPDTLKELRDAWRSVDDAVHVNAFIDMHDIGDALLRSQLADPVMDTENLVLTYSDGMEIMRDLKAMGAHNVTAGRNHNLTGKSRLKKMLKTYEDFRLADGKLPATYEVIYGHAWGTENIEKQHTTSDGSITIPISQLKSNR